ncbi:inositol hexakisphosphate and diphosphoinositol-pentakisphosphate kinase-like protein [Dermatophagoides farinae]|uniref:Inositol hexakisphosphate and diphosphoinositol-pentakisphosphate kinase n=1 Tax=Dermatophagoides farinae TaxID=6954 RepID=A0A9D4NU24_DERFA|nr:inositol hexakisphosphate and diphosphoinositol-pentakisphosphate kinase-like protein [Dermatophagoides farinae]
MFFDLETFGDLEIGCEQKQKSAEDDYNYDYEKDEIDDDDDDDDVEEEKQVLVGICAMSKKSQSKPMKEILSRLNEFEYIRTIVFDESIILESPVNEWPIVDCLISFHSKGFPLNKAIEYANLREPFVINDLHLQYDIQDRRKVYKTIEDSGIELPRYVVLDRDSPNPDEGVLIESEDSIEVNGVVFNKPFVEKPISAEDHNIYIYYPSSAGGGSQRLFRKIGSRSSVYSQESQVRKTGSYIYEEFMPTDGTDVKVYTVGPDYAHAEARKSPALDGKVERDKDGKEVRYPVMLSNAEKLIARKVCLAFKQTVCGFDLLRANGISYVCDVNGFSFVKNSMKYYDDASKLLGNMILRILAPQLHIPWSIPFQLDDPPIMPTTFGKMMELRCVVGVIRHGDRTPKQKMKMEVKHPKFFEIFKNYGGFKDNQHHVKLKQPKQLQEILDVARYLLSEIDQNHDPEIEENRSKLEQLKSVLEMYGHFSGINRKVQLKYQPKGRPRRSSSEEDLPREPSLLCIVKWGGELTPRGRIQAEEMGRLFRCMYPGGQGEYSGNQGLGFLRLHSTFRHDLKIYASDEGRVQMTAAAFAKGLLALEGELTPILVQMVKSANTNGLLDNDCDSSKFQNMVKQKIHELMQSDHDFTDEDEKRLNPMKAPSIVNAMNFVKNPVKSCDQIHNYIKKLNNLIKERRNESHLQDAHLYYGETWDLMQRRWSKLEKDFKLKCGKYDITKIPDIYDCIKYDLQHNQHFLQSSDAHDFYTHAKAMADIVIPQEYGTNVYEKLTIGLGTCTPLLKKIKADLLSIITDAESVDAETGESVNRLNPQYSYGVSSPGRHVRTRLYFTSESHIHSLLNVIRLGGLFDESKDEQWKRAMDYISVISELNYLTQIVIMLYEDQTKNPKSDDRFHVELHFSPGVVCCLNQKNLPKGPGFRTQTGSRSTQTKKVVLSSSLPSSIKEEDEFGYNDDETNHNEINSTINSVFMDGTNVIQQQQQRQESTMNYNQLSSMDIHNNNNNNNHKQSTTNKIALNDSTTAMIITCCCSNCTTTITTAIAATNNKLNISTSSTTSNTNPQLPSIINSTHCRYKHINKIINFASNNQAIDSPVIIEEPESPGEKTSMAIVEQTSMKSQPIPITVSTCSIDRKISNSNEETTGLITRRIKKMPTLEKENSIALSWNDVSVAGGGGREPRHSATSFRKGYRNSIPTQLMRLYIPENQQFGSTSTLFSTAVISGSSSTPNLQDNVVIDAPGQPTIRPLETLHNALSLRYLSEFLDKMITSPWYRFPCSPSKSPMPVLMPMPSMEQSDLLSVVPLSDKFESNLQVVHNNQRQQQQRKQPQSEHDDISECFHSSDHS